jgi:diguanylate cyclase (GGDEF)-like protein
MGTFLQYDISIYAMLYLGMLFVLIMVRKEIYSVSSKLILHIIGVNLLTLFFELMSWVFDGVEGNLYYILSYTFNTLLFVSVGFIVAYWMSYVDYVIYHSKERLVKRYHYMWVAVVTTVFALVNLFVPILFEVTSENLYVRGRFYNVYFFLFVLLFVFNLVKTLYQQNVEDKANVLWSIFIFLGLVLLAGVLQSIYYGLILVWPVMALATSIVYIFLETTTNNRDYVTKLYTRVKSDQYMRHLMDDGKSFAVVMIDLDDYKNINDTYGHVMGDQVIRIFAKILDRLFSKDGMVSRFGGDEFLIVLVEVNKAYLEEKKLAIQRQVKEELGKLPLKDLRFSYGYSFDQTGKTVEELIIEADDYMYQNKAENKNYKRRKTD